MQYENMLNLWYVKGEKRDHCCIITCTLLWINHVNSSSLIQHQFAHHFPVIHNSVAVTGRLCPPSKQWTPPPPLFLSPSSSLPPFCLVNPAVRWRRTEVSRPRRVTLRFPSIIHRAAAASALVFNSPDDHIIPPPPKEREEDGARKRSRGRENGERNRFKMRERMRRRRRKKQSKIFKQAHLFSFNIFWVCWFILFL